MKQSLANLYQKSPHNPTYDRLHDITSKKRDQVSQDMTSKRRNQGKDPILNTTGKKYGSQMN